MEAVNKSVHNAISNHNEVFLNTFHNTIKEAIHGIPVGQVGSTCYNILDLSTQGTNQVGTSHQEAAPANNDDVQVFQSLSEQVQVAHQAKYRRRLKK